MKFLTALKRREPIDLERHDEILKEMRRVTEKLRLSEPITMMVRGEWRDERDKEGTNDAHD